MSAQRMLLLYNFLITHLPGSRAGRLKAWWLRKSGVEIADGVQIGNGVTVKLYNAKLRIGRNCRINDGVVFNLSGSELEIGNCVVLQEFVSFFAAGSNGCCKIADGVIIRKRVDFEYNCGGKIFIGENSEINHGTLLAANCGATITVGNNVRIAHFISMKCTTHAIAPKSEVCIAGDTVVKDISIGDGTWVGGSATILPGVSIGKCSIIAGGAVVTKDVPDGVLAAGVPAVVKKDYHEL